jgi:hypothetical protein
MSGTGPTYKYSFPTDTRIINFEKRHKNKLDNADIYLKYASDSIKNNGLNISKNSTLHYESSSYTYYFETNFNNIYNLDVVLISAVDQTAASGAEVNPDSIVQPLSFNAANNEINANDYLEINIVYANTNPYTTIYNLIFNVSFNTINPTINYSYNCTYNSFAA